MITIIKFTDLRSMEEGCFTNGKLTCHFSFFVYAFCRLLDLDHKLKKKVSVIRKYHNHILHTNPRHREGDAWR